MSECGILRYSEGQYSDFSQENVLIRNFFTQRSLYEIILLFKGINNRVILSLKILEMFRRLHTT